MIGIDSGQSICISESHSKNQNGVRWIRASFVILFDQFDCSDVTGERERYDMNIKSGCHKI